MKKDKKTGAKAQTKKIKIMLINKDTGEILIEAESKIAKINTDKEKWIFQDRLYKIELDLVNE